MSVTIASLRDLSPETYVIHVLWSPLARGRLAAVLGSMRKSSLVNKKA